MKSFLIFILFLFFTSQTFATESIPKMGSYEQLDPSFRASISDYQLGDEWGKIKVTEELLQTSVAIARAARATAKVGGATGFILGEFDGEVVVATNHHVCPSLFFFRCSTVSFPFLNMNLRTKEMIGTWQEIDLTLLTVQVSGTDKQRLLRVAKNFDFNKSLQAGDPLVTSGFGTAGNSGRDMMINFDSDCRVTSANEEFRLMSDPDGVNTGSYKAWSFSNACDVSHGDSGSAMVDKTSGSPIGIIWTGRIPKSSAAQTSSFILQWEQGQSEEIWQELSYAVPAKKIAEVITGKLQAGEINMSFVPLVEELLLEY